MYWSKWHSYSIKYIKRISFSVVIAHIEISSLSLSLSICSGTWWYAKNITPRRYNPIFASKQQLSCETDPSSQGRHYLSKWKSFIDACKSYHLVYLIFDPVTVSLTSKQRIIQRCFYDTLLWDCLANTWVKSQNKQLK